MEISHALTHIYLGIRDSNNYHFQWCVFVQLPEIGPGLVTMTIYLLLLIIDGTLVIVQFNAISFINSFM